MEENKKKAPSRIPNLRPAKKPVPNSPKINGMWIYGMVLIGLLLLYEIVGHKSPQEITYNQFKNDYLRTGKVKSLEIYKEGELWIVNIFLKKATTNPDPKGNANNAFVPQPAPDFQMTQGSSDTFDKNLKEDQKDLPAGSQISPDYVTKSNILELIGPFILPIALLLFFWFFVIKRISGPGGGGPGGQIFNIGKSKATLFDRESQVNITFNDVAGLEEAKQEVMEIVDFLKNPKKYTNLGGKIPKGALLVGAPGTGKTLLAKAVAGEAQVPFFSLSGSDFVEMFVGVGASRVRDLFKQARDKAPCIIFIDEIDAIGRARGKNQIMGGNDERENTLNQLLVEMDGFGTDSGVIIIAATNRPDVLDSALLRPGRFDRQISIDKPDLNEREQIFLVHLKPLKLAEGVDPKKLSAQTPGFAGAEIANVCNEAALIAARKDKLAVDMQDFQDAIDRVIGGLEKKNKIISPEEKKIVAYHEAGHAIAGWFLEHADPLVKVSIVPRGVAALGYAQYLPKEQFLYTTEQLTDGMCLTMGGRVAEDIVFGRISTGAQNDLERITKLAYAMVTYYGMNGKVGNLSFNDSGNEYTFGKPYSDQTANMIDIEVRTLVEEIYATTKDLLIKNRVGLEAVAQKLIEKEILFQSDLEEILGKRPFENRTAYDEFVNGKTVLSPIPELNPESPLLNEKPQE